MGFLVSRRLVCDIREEDLSWGSLSWMGTARAYLGWCSLPGLEAPLPAAGMGPSSPPDWASQACPPLSVNSCQAL